MFNLSSIESCNWPETEFTNSVIPDKPNPASVKLINLLSLVSVGAFLIEI